MAEGLGSSSRNVNVNRSSSSEREGQAREESIDFSGRCEFFSELSSFPGEAIWANFAEHAVLRLSMIVRSLKSIEEFLSSCDDDTSDDLQLIAANVRELIHLL